MFLSRVNHNSTLSISLKYKQQRIIQPENNVLILKNRKNPMYFTYLIPVYCCFMVRRIKSLNISEQYSEVTGTLYLSILYKGIQQQHSNYLLQNLIVYVNDQQKIIFTNNENQRQYEVLHDQKQQMTTFILTKTFEIQMDSEIFFAPFQRLYLHLSLRICPFYLNQKNSQGIRTGRVITYRFNIMNNTQLKTSFPFFKHNLIFGQYSLATNYSYRQIKIFPDEYVQQHSRQLFQDEAITNENQQSTKQYTEYNVVQYKMMLYRHPIVSISSIFVPLWIMDFVILLIFYQDNNFSNRIINTATILIAFSAYFNVIRNMLPSSQSITIIQIIVYMDISTCVLGLIRAIQVKQYDKNTWHQVGQQDPLFILCFFIVITSILLVVIAVLTFKLYFQRKYRSPKLQRKQLIIRRWDWSNQKTRQALTAFSERLILAETNKPFDPVINRSI